MQAEAALRNGIYRTLKLRSGWWLDSILFLLLNEPLCTIAALQCSESELQKVTSQLNEPLRQKVPLGLNEST